MKNPIRPISISLFTAFFVALFLFLLFVFGRFTFQQINQLDSRFQQASQTRAAKEIDRAVDRSIEKVQHQTAQLAAWEEVRQQLHNPTFYGYWYRHRANTNSLISDYIIDVAIYDENGSILSQIDTALLPHKIDTQSDQEYILMNQFEPLLVTIEPVTNESPGPVFGYVATLSRIIPLFLSSGQFNQVDVETLNVDTNGADKIDAETLKSLIRYQLNSDDYADDLRQVMTETVIWLASLAALLSLIIFPLAAHIISHPILRIAQHVDSLKRHPREPVDQEFQQPLLIMELDKIRQSLNDYHNQLNHVSSTLNEKTRQLQDLTHHDPLTGARSRSAFDEYWHEINDVFHNGRGRVSLILFDVDHFRAINDTYGHEVGDELLITVSQLIRSILPSRDQLFRLGGDEFSAVLIGCHPRKAMQIAKQVQLAISRYPFDKLGIREPVRLSMGVAHTQPTDASSLASLQWQANTAVYYAKRPGQPSIMLFTEEMAENTQGLFSNRTHSAVYDAVAHGTGLVMHYQPIVDLRNGEPHYFEALARIVHEGQLIMPSHIFPLIEAKGLEVDLDRAVFQRIHADLSNGVIPLGTGVSINISAPTLIESDLFEWLENLRPFMHDYKLLLEITETALITQMQTARSHLSRLQSMGFRVALDDFGSGYSSLRYLGTMPVDVVKFDINLTRLIDTKSNSILTHLAQMIVDCGHLLVAEGIESASSAKQLANLGFRYGQGYYFGKPASVIELPPAVEELNHTA
ncbi:MAG: bifunctional diguanylate cyclase/phosphodiesterase [Candidatus Thiodiazotropha sp.]